GSCGQRLAPCCAPEKSTWKRYATAAPSLRRRPLLSGGSAHAIDQFGHVTGKSIAAPADMAVRPHQHEAAFVKRRNLRLGDVDDLQRNAVRGRRVLQIRRFDLGEAQQHESTAE